MASLYQLEHHIMPKLACYPCYKNLQFNLVVFGS